MTENWLEGGFGIYVHWPFCESKCPYCDFNSHVQSNVSQKKWANELRVDLESYGKEIPNRTLNSIYFGGGTPSLMDVETVETIIMSAKAQWNFSNNIEITLEANPGSVETEKLSGFRQVGVNRISMGIQALNDSDLKKLGRLHSVEDAYLALDKISSEFDRFSFDLIYARQDQSLASWESELTEALSFGASHLSLYQLTIEDGTAFGRRFAAGQLNGLPDEDLAADMYELTQAKCEQAGLPAYEVSNYAAPGHESVHNQIYWNSGDFVGIGPGAHGRISLDGKRIATSTILMPNAWLKSNSREKRTFLSKEDERSELLLMGLRTKTGISKKRLYELDFRNDSVLKQFIAEGFLRETSGKIAATQSGRMLLNSLLAELID